MSVAFFGEKDNNCLSPHFFEASSEFNLFALRMAKCSHIEIRFMVRLLNPEMCLSNSHDMMCDFDN